MSTGNQPGDEDDYWSLDNPGTQHNKEFDDDFDRYFGGGTEYSSPRRSSSGEDLTGRASERGEVEGGFEGDVGRIIDGKRKGYKALMAFGCDAFDAFVETSQPYKRKLDAVLFGDSSVSSATQPAEVRTGTDSKVLSQIASVTGAGVGHVIGATIVGTAQLGSKIHKHLFARGMQKNGKKEPFGKWMKRAARNLVLTVAGGAAAVGGCEYYNGSTSEKPDQKSQSGSDVRDGSTIEKWLDSAGKKAGELGDDAKRWAEKQMK